MVAFSKAIVSEADDGQDPGASWSDRDSPYASATYFGIKQTPSATTMGGMRFIEITIPQGSTINAATITLNVFGQTGTLTGIQLFGDDVDNAVAWSNTSRPQSGFTDTTPGTLQTTIPAAGNLVIVDCLICVQEIVDRTGWNNGSAMRFRLEMAATYAEARFDDYEASGVPVEAVLDIDYTAPAAGSKPTNFYKTLLAGTS